MFGSQTSYLFCSETEKSLPHTLNMTNSASCSAAEKIATCTTCIYFETLLGRLILFSVTWRSSVVCGTAHHLETSHAPTDDSLGCFSQWFWEPVLTVSSSVPLPNHLNTPYYEQEKRMWRLTRYWSLLQTPCCPIGSNLRLWSIVS